MTALPAAAQVEMATDYLLGLATFVWGLRLLRRRRMPNVQLYWGIGFLAVSAAAFVGGTFHGFAAMQSPTVHSHLWNATLLLIGAGAGFLIAGAFSGPLRPWAENAHWIYAGAGLAVAAMLLRRGHAALGALGFNDLFHLLEIAAFYCFFRGARMTDAAQAGGSRRRSPGTRA